MGSLCRMLPKLCKWRLWKHFSVRIIVSLSIGSLRNWIKLTTCIHGHVLGCYGSVVKIITDFEINVNDKPDPFYERCIK